MKKHKLNILFPLCIISLYANLLYAGMWITDPNKVYSFKLKPFEKYELQNKDTNWINSLIENLKKNGNVESYFEFVKTDLKLKINDEDSSYPVYVSVNNPNQYLYYESIGHTFLMDFKEREVFIPCCGGLSFHPNKTKDIIVIVQPC